MFVSAAFSMKYLDIYSSDSYALPSTEGNISIANQWHNVPMGFSRVFINGGYSGRRRCRSCIFT